MDAFAKYYNAILRYLSYRPRSIKEVRGYLHRKQAGEETTEQIIEKLLEQKFLNDEEFARMLVRQRTEFKPKGVRLLKQELKQKGVSEALIDSVLEERKDTASELSLAISLLIKRKKQYGGLEQDKLYQRAGGFLGRKGFDFGVIKAAIDEVFGKRV